MTARLFDDRPRPATVDDGLADARRIIDAARSEHGPIVTTFLLLSGGNDSMVLYDTCREFADHVVHINTGIGIPETNEFVRDLVGPDLIELHPPVPYDDLVLGRWRGFPGPGGHIYAYTMLKERALRAVLKDHRAKRGQRFMLLTGARADESDRRMGTTEEARRMGGQVWVNPLLHWSNDLMREYRSTRRLPVNPVTEHLHMSGECLCGAFARPGELDHIAFFYPEFAERIRALEARVRDAGLPACKWGEKPPRKGDAAPGPMCNQCTLWDDEGAA